MALKALWDVKLEDHGTLILFYTKHQGVQDWFDDHTDATHFCGSYVVERRYAGDIVEALRDEGFNVQ